MTDPLQQLGSSGRYCGIGHPDDALRSCILRPGHEVPHRTMDGRRWSDPEHGLEACRECKSITCDVPANVCCSMCSHPDSFAPGVGDMGGRPIPEGRPSHGLERLPSPASFHAPDGTVEPMQARVVTGPDGHPAIMVERPEGRLQDCKPDDDVCIGCHAIVPREAEECPECGEEDVWVTPMGTQDRLPAT